jgi:hypothetical protein
MRVSILLCFILGLATCRSRPLDGAGPGIVTADAAIESAGTGGQTQIDDDASAGEPHDGGAPFRLLGEPCVAAGDCVSGFCIDGVCCNTSCTSGCARCDAPGTTGTCVLRPAGDLPRTPGSCLTEAPSTCGLDGRCDGAGACRLWPQNTRCASGSCSGDAVVGEQACDGAGHCKPGSIRICVPYTCDSATATCRTGCTTDADCRGSYCEATGRCHTSSGPPCTTGDECASGFCSSGVCCDVACTDPSMSCNQPGKEGRCSPLPAEKKPNGAACALSTECASAFCADGVCCNVACNAPCVSCVVPGSFGTCLDGRCSFPPMD